MDPFDGITDIVKKRKAKTRKTNTKSVDMSDDKAVDILATEKETTKRKKERKSPPQKEEPVPKRQKKCVVVRGEDDRRTIALLTEYGKNEWLGPYLCDNHDFQLQPSKLRKMSSDRLYELLDDIEQVLANKGNSAIGDGIVRGAMSHLERLSSATTGYDITGTTDKCFSNDHWRFLLERAKMKYGVGFGSLDPVAELTLVTFQTAAMMHYSNSIRTPITDLDTVFDDELLKKNSS